ncbi:uncharacterized protein LOC127709745 [Mytilus californianus]|uniref:uncharacterized protein LOC127709745 n=1 Tax=Mytilus californianus TaxID=6549 RepID=UPI002247B7E7|nr:uncharacterized protein LOC127709745 [Mytilus californianus]
MASFEDCINFCKIESGLFSSLDIILKEKQLETLKALYFNKDCISVLPTGYGKSLIFQILPWFFQKKLNRLQPMTVLVASPLNSLMQDQVLSLRKKGIKACSLNISGTKGITFEEDDDTENELETDVPFEQLQKGEYQILYVHPETFSNKKFGKLMRSEAYQTNVCCIVIDEVHMISEWGESFRPEFMKLGELTCLFETAGHLALTATATPKALKELEVILNYRETTLIISNPDRPNIFLEVRRRLPNIRKVDKLDELIKPIAEQLYEQQSDFPLTVIYVENLESLGYYFRYLEYELKEKGYHGENITENRMFAQYHSDYPETMKQHIVKDLCQSKPILRLVLATVALGMGLNAPSIRRIIHCRPPTTLEKYMQEIGRAGRNGDNAEAIMYFNNSDLSKARAGLTSSVIEYCKNENNCFRKLLVKYFGFDDVLYAGDKKRCCSFCSLSN